MFRSVVALSLGLLFLPAATGQQSNIQPDPAKSVAHLASILTKLKQRQIASVEVLWMNPESESRASVMPTELDEQYFRRVEIRRFYGDRIEKNADICCVAHQTFKS